MLAFYADLLTGAEEAAVRDHLASCRSCLELAEDARRFLVAMGEGGESDPALTLAETRRATRQWRWPAATAAGLALLTVGLWLREPDWTPPVATPQGPWHDLPVAKVAYTPAAEDTSLSQAMSPYTQGDFSEAERRLGVYLEERPGDRRAQLYRGVSLLLLGRTDEAIPPLESATAAAGSLGAEARWYLSLGLLKAGDTTRALAELDAVAQQSAQHLAESRALQVRVRASVR